jgi:hypothetical protein
MPCVDRRLGTHPRRRRRHGEGAGVDASSGAAACICLWIRSSKVRTHRSPSDWVFLPPNHVRRVLVSQYTNELIVRKRLIGSSSHLIHRDLFSFRLLFPFGTELNQLSLFKKKTSFSLDRDQQRCCSLQYIETIYRYYIKFKWVPETSQLKYSTWILQDTPVLVMLQSMELHHMEKSIW